MHINTTFDGRFIINSYSEEEIVVNLQPYSSHFVITPEKILTPWNVECFKHLNADALEILLTDKPEVCLLATGKTHKTPPVSLLANLVQKGIALEVMNTAAACRTFNILATEGRRVSVGFLFD